MYNHCHTQNNPMFCRFQFCGRMFGSSQLMTNVTTLKMCVNTNTYKKHIWMDFTVMFICIVMTLPQTYAHAFENCWTIMSCHACCLQFRQHFLFAHMSYMFNKHVQLLFVFQPRFCMKLSKQCVKQQSCTYVFLDTPNAFAIHNTCHKW